MPEDPQVLIRQLDDADVTEIRTWPQYKGEFKPLDYALRCGGWLDIFPESAKTRRFGAWSHGKLIGFSLLTDITKESAEFYIALHPAETRQGFGRLISETVLRIAFEQMTLSRVYLKVRTWHIRAIALYKEIGFIRKGKKREKIQGGLVDFYLMEIRRDDFLQRSR